MKYQVNPVEKGYCTKHSAPLTPVVFILKYTVFIWNCNNMPPNTSLYYAMYFSGWIYLIGWTFRVNFFLCPRQTAIWNRFTTPFTDGETVSSQRLHLQRLRWIVSRNTWWQKDYTFWSEPLAQAQASAGIASKTVHASRLIGS